MNRRRENSPGRMTGTGMTTIHPFPARMAPHLAREALRDVPSGGLVLDPMCGSGTVLRASVENAFHGVGVDIDPLAALMSRVWTTPLDPGQILRDSEDLIRKAKSLPSAHVARTNDDETRRFVSYWFAPPQESQLARIATVLGRDNRVTSDALAIALSRIIVSKEKLASLARDTSHSRPHRVADTNDYDVYNGFLRSCRILAGRLKPDLIQATADIRVGDARSLDWIADESVDLTLTSPPYLNAIDYIRGHRLSLVWMGHMVASLRKTRSANVGAERGMAKEESSIAIAGYVTKREGSTIDARHLGWIRRYAMDMQAVLQEIHRTLKLTGRLVLVLGNSFIRGAAIDNAALVESIAKRVGFQVVRRRTREIPARRRYLPPPGKGKGALDFRMRKETVVTLRPKGGGGEGRTDESAG